MSIWRRVVVVEFDPVAERRRRVGARHRPASRFLLVNGTMRALSRADRRRVHRHEDVRCMDGRPHRVNPPGRFEWLRALGEEIPGVVITHFSFDTPLRWTLRAYVDGDEASLTWDTARLLLLDEMNRRGFYSAVELIRFLARFARQARADPQRFYEMLERCAYR